MSNFLLKLSIIAYLLLINQITFSQKFTFDPHQGTYITETGQQVVRCASVEMHNQRMAMMQQRGIDIPSEQEFEDWLQKVKSKQANQRAYTGVIQIPVVVHVVHNGEAVGSGANISDAQVIAQIEVLNEDFRRQVGTPGYNSHPDGADTEIEFVLAKRDPAGAASNGINRYNGGQAFWERTAIEGTLKPATIWNPDEYMNMWTLNFGGADASLLGYAQFPDGSGLTGLNCNGGSANTDGLVMGYQFFGSTDKGTFPNMSAPYDKGRTATHEIGHGLGLRHIWGDGDCTVDDYMADTPTADGANYGCTASTSCGSADMIENYMDYSDDACMNIFTVEQKIRMRTVLLNSDRRVSWLTSPALTAPATNDAAIVAVNSPTTQTCSATITPDITVLNTGSNTITSISIISKIDGSQVNNDTWNGTLAVGNSTTITLSSTTVALGDYTYSAEINLVNGSTDSESSNNTYAVTFSYTEGLTLPLTESFESGTFPPVNWTSNNVGSGCYYWVNQSTTGSDGNDTNTAFINHYNFNSPGSTDELISPIIDLTSESTAQLQFDVAYARYDATNHESLKVYVSTDCGNTYGAAIYDKNGSNGLETVADQTGDWFPSAAGDWRTETIDLSAYVGNMITVKFESTNGWGNNLFLDNIYFPSFEPLISFVTGSSSITESTSAGSGCRAYTDVSINMQIANAPSGDALVTVNVNGSSTAVSPADYKFITPMPITFSSGSTTNQSFTVRIYDDAAIESDESIILEYTIGGTTNAAAGATNQTHTLTINDNDSAPTSSTTSTLFTESFDSGLAGWSTTQGTTGNRNNWLAGTGCTSDITGGTAQVAYYNNGGNNGPFCGYGNYTSEIYLYREIDATNYSTLSMAFDYICEGDPGNDFGSLVYSTNTVTPSWTSLANYAGVTTATSTTVNLPSALDNSSFLIGFKWTSNNTTSNAQSFAVDNISISGTTTGDLVETDLNATTTEYLGPNSTVAFYDEISGEIMGMIINTSSHDYGCTTFTIDRSGTGTKEFWSASSDQYLMDKTYLVTPTNNNANGTYTIKLFLTETEVANWESATSKLRSALMIAKTPGAASNITAANPNANGDGNVLGTNNIGDIYGSDYFIQANFVSGFSGFGVGDPGPPPSALPLELSDFKVTLVKDKAHLQWTSLTEINTDYIEIHHSNNGKEFNPIGTVAAAGNSQNPINYTFTHHDLDFGPNYYKLKMVDLDGSYEFSKMVQVFQAISDFEITNVFPMPAKEQLNINYRNDQEAKVSLTLIDLWGNTKMVHNANSSKGSNNIQLNVSALSSGVYFIIINNGFQQLEEKIVIE